MTTWPPGILFDPEADSFGVDDQDNRISFRTEVAAGKRRRRSTARWSLHRVRLLLGDTEKGLLLGFYGDELADGTLRFTMTDPLRGDDCAFTFETPISWSAASYGKWYASFTLRRMP